MTNEKQNKNLQITPETTLDKMLSVFPELEAKLVEFAPVFEKLTNPILRDTVAKVTTLKQASLIGKIPIGDLINQLRKAVNQSEVKIETNEKNNKSKPDWVVEQNVVETYDAIIDLENGIHPAARVTKDILKLNGKEMYLLVTPFIPAPLIKIVEEKGFETHSIIIDEHTVKTFIIKVNS